MSVGNLKTQGNKGNNMPYQLAVLQLLDTINSSILTGGGGGADYETRTTTYQAVCTVCGPGYSTGDILVRYDIIAVPAGTITTTVWFNQNTQLTIAPPVPTNIVAIGGPTSVTVTNFPAVQPVSGTVNIGTMPEVEIKNDTGNPVPVNGTVNAAQSGTWNINNISGSIPLPSGAATETTLDAINTKLTPAVRTHNTISSSAPGTVPAGSLRGSVMNIGSAAGTWNGISLPAGVVIPWDAVGPRDTYGAIAFDATGTTFIIEYTT